jgi:ABC-2 type transport system ATP-binding protein
MSIAIRLAGVEKGFQGNMLFSNICLEIESGSVVGFRGGNGSGKSVLFKLIAGLYSPDEGEIYVRGERLGADCDFPSDLGLLVDNPGFIELFSGLDNLRMLADIRKRTGETSIVAIMSLLGLDPKSRKRVKNYSLGMKQKLGIAQAVMEDQDIVLLDEPFNALDAESNKKLYDLIKKLKTEGKTVLLTSHNQSDLDLLCDVQYDVPSFEKVA